MRLGVKAVLSTRRRTASRPRHKDERLLNPPCYHLASRLPRDSRLGGYKSRTDEYALLTLALSREPPVVDYSVLTPFPHPARKSFRSVRPHRFSATPALCSDPQQRTPLRQRLYKKFSLLYSAAESVVNILRIIPAQPHLNIMGVHFLAR